MRFTAITGVLLLSLATCLSAAEPGEPGDEIEAPQEVTDTPPPATDATEGPVDADGERATDDYRPSEEISEDLSVKFPIDI